MHHRPGQCLLDHDLHGLVRVRGQYNLEHIVGVSLLHHGAMSMSEELRSLRP
jgi:hypothetical protein